MVRICPKRFNTSIMTVFRKLLKGKIHRATVTNANLDYEGSVTIDPGLMEAAGIVPYESVAVWDITNGARLETYAIVGKPNSGEICINGAGAHLIHKGDLVIIAVFSYVTDDLDSSHLPKIVLVDEQNTIKDN